jgi:hypothetical protein
MKLQKVAKFLNKKKEMPQAIPNKYNETANHNYLSSLAAISVGYFFGIGTTLTPPIRLLGFTSVPTVKSFTFTFAHRSD